MINVLLYGFGIFTVVSNTFLTPLLFIIRFLLGYHYYVIRHDTEKTRAVSKMIQSATYNSITLFQCGNFYPDGYFINRKCVGYYNYNHNSYDSVAVAIHIMTTPVYFQTIFETEKATVSFITSTVKESPPTKISTLTVFSRVGSYTHLFYSRFRIDVQGLQPMGTQPEIVTSICEHYLAKKRGVVYIHGVSGAGKSTIGLLVACRLNGCYCHTFNPTEPGDTLSLLIRDSEPTDERPTIVLLEEANVLIRAVHEGTLQRHKNITTSVFNKSTYNTFFDDLILYRNVLIIMTSNEDKETIDKLDPCYLRKGRVDAYFSMMETLPL